MLQLPHAWVGSGLHALLYPVHDSWGAGKAHWANGFFLLAEPRFVEVMLCPGLCPGQALCKSSVTLAWHPGAHSPSLARRLRFATRVVVQTPLDLAVTAEGHPGVVVAAVMQEAAMVHLVDGPAGAPSSTVAAVIVDLEKGNGKFGAVTPEGHGHVKEPSPLSRWRLTHLSAGAKAHPHSTQDGHRESLHLVFPSGFLTLCCFVLSWLYIQRYIFHPPFPHIMWFLARLLTLLILWTVTFGQCNLF